jgi:hypothetical protein
MGLLEYALGSHSLKRLNSKESKGYWRGWRVEQG